MKGKCWNREILEEENTGKENIGKENLGKENIGRGKKNIKNERHER